MAGLAIDDSFAGRLAEWREELTVRERDLLVWDGKVVFKKPPPVPTVKTYGRTKDEALLAQRQAAYDVADAERTEAHNR